MKIIYNHFKMLKKSYCWICLILLFIGFSKVHAQGNGIITGTVTEESTGEPLIGASVMLQGTNLGTATSVEGEYTIRRVRPGDYTLEVGYIGYQKKEISITVTAGETLELDVSLVSVAVEGEEVNITAQAAGQRSAINEQLSSNTIKNVVSAARIRDVPDANAAESIGRLSGVSVVRSGGEGQKVTIRGMSPQYNVIQVNGVRMQSTDRDNRSVDLNMIAPNVLSGISVSKALTADMDADAVGGTVNLSVDKAEEGFHSNFSVQSGYTSMANTTEEKFGNYRLSGLVTNRFFDSKIGVQVSGFLDDHNRNSDVLGAGYGVPDDEGDEIEGELKRLTLQNTTINDRITDRQRLGGSLVVDYDFSNGSLILNNFISRLNEDQITQNNYFTTGLDWRGDAQDNEFTNTVINNSLQGEFEFSNIEMDFSLSSSISRQRNPNNLRMDIRPQSGGVQGLDPTASDLNQMTPTDFLNSVEVINSGKIMTGTSSLIRDVDATAQAAELNFSVPYNLTDNLSGNLKFGGKYERNTRKNDEDVLYLDTDRGGMAGDFIDLLKEEAWTDLGMADDDTYVKARLVRDPDYEIEDFLSGNEGVNGDKFYNLISIDKMHRMEQIAREYGYYLPDPLGSNQYDYDYTRNFNAFYIMPEINVGEYITLQPGIRYEAFTFDYTADSTRVRGRLTTPGEDYFDSETINMDAIDGKNWFPQVQVQVKPTDWFDVRLARTESIIYPDYRAISPYIFMDTYASPTLRLGNPSLKPSTAVNYDAYVSIYENHIGLFTAGVFHKEMDDFIVPIEYYTKDASKINNRINLPQSGDPTTINTWTNLDKTSTVRGIELEWQTHFWYLPSVFQGLILNINYTHMNSETHYPRYYTKRTGTFPNFRTEVVDTTRSGRLINQPNDILNLTVGYDIGGFSARLSYQYTDNILRGVQTTYDELDSYTAPYKRLDFSARQKLPWLEGLEAYLNVNNITNTPDRVHISTRSKLSSVQYYGRTAALGVRYSF